LEETVNPVNHFVVVYEVALVGGRNATLNAFDKAGLALQHVADGLLHHLRSILSLCGRQTV
jgi:hypothetical protein